MRKKRGARSHFMKNPARNRPLGIPRLMPTWEDNIRIDLKEIG
jgi:hypothetical protein